MQIIRWLGIILVVNLIVYWRTFDYDLVSDDVERFYRKDPVGKNKLHRLWLQFMSKKIYHKRSAHITTTLIHTTVCMLIFLGLGCNTISLMTAFLFAVNPINTRVSMWISGKGYGVSTILSLLMVMFPLLSPLPFYLTRFFAVNAWFMPLVFIGTPYWFMVIPLVIVWLLTKANRYHLRVKLWETGGIQTTNEEMRSIKIKKLIVFIKTFGFYFRLCLIPWKFGIDHIYLYGFGTNKIENAKGYKIDKEFWIGLGIALICVLSLLKFGMVSWVWGLWWFAVNIAMWCNFVTYQQQIDSRFAYLANVGLMYTLAHFLMLSPIAYTAFFIFYLTRLWYIQPMFINDYWAIEATMHEMKNLHYMWLMKGVKKFCSKDYVGALNDFNEAYNCKPYDFKVLFNLAVSWVMVGNIKEAKKFAQLAEENIYDGLDKGTENARDGLQETIKSIELQTATSSMVNIDMAKVFVVK